MNTGHRPFLFAATLSLVLHAALLGVVLPEQQYMQAAGQGINIELVSSIYVSAQRETEQASRQTVVPLQQQKDQRPGSDTVIADREKPVIRPLPESPALSAASVSSIETIVEDTGSQVVNRSTNASLQAVSILDLLHTKISEHKQYPYLAKRQRREGVARVEFVLHPDGTINDTRLVASSRTRILDKAALDAVQGIEPFEPAGDYLHQPEAFQVDVVFNML